MQHVNVKQYFFAGKLFGQVSSRTCKALSHCCPFSQAEMVALNIMRSCSILLQDSRWKKRKKWLRAYIYTTDHNSEVRIYNTWQFGMVNGTKEDWYQLKASQHLTLQCWVLQSPTLYTGFSYTKRKSNTTSTTIRNCTNDKIQRCFSSDIPGLKLLEADSWRSSKAKSQWPSFSTALITDEKLTALVSPHDEWTPIWHG